MIHRRARAPHTAAKRVPLPCLLTATQLSRPCHAALCHRAASPTCLASARSPRHTPACAAAFGAFRARILSSASARCAALPLDDDRAPAPPLCRFVPSRRSRQAYRALATVPSRPGHATSPTLVPLPTAECNRRPHSMPPLTTSPPPPRPRQLSQPPPARTGRHPKSPPWPPLAPFRRCRYAAALLRLTHARPSLSLERRRPRLGMSPIAAMERCSCHPCAIVIAPPDTDRRPSVVILAPSPPSSVDEPALPPSSISSCHRDCRHRLSRRRLPRLTITDATPPFPGYARIHRVVTVSAPRRRLMSSPPRRSSVAALRAPPPIGRLPPYAAVAI
ncbi:extensin-like [Oryza brachyantha]|uniref:extensin-like n=1 Tax=Oryza brachyantha TaxID=4533 RepID=UPI001ADD1D90|nr:extensin-like [Oryza brachyantha]